MNILDLVAESFRKHPLGQTLPSPAEPPVRLGGYDAAGASTDPSPVDRVAPGRIAELARVDPRITERVARPTVEDHPFARPDELARWQRDWDAAEAQRQAMLAAADRLGAERAKREAAAAAKRAAVAEAQRSRVEDEVLAPARAAYLRSGGTEAGFEQDRAEILARVRRERAVAAASDPNAAGDAELRRMAGFR